jgi:Zn/Cd-binding protein ZinT
MRNKNGTGYEIVDNHDGTYTLLELHGEKTYVVVANVTLDEVLEAKKDLESPATRTDFKTYFKDIYNDRK